VVAELKILRAQHFASSSSGGQTIETHPRSLTSGASASVGQARPPMSNARPAELSLVDMGSDSLLTLSPSSASSVPQRATDESSRQPRRSPLGDTPSCPGRDIDIRHSGSPAESASSSGRPTTRSAEPRPTAMGMSSLVAAVLGGRGDARSTAQPANHFSPQFDRNAGNASVTGDRASVRQSHPAHSRCVELGGSTVVQPLIALIVPASYIRL
jgi:hypothetical protein